MPENHLDHILDKKIERLEKWMVRLEKELVFLKHVSQLNTEKKQSLGKTVQLELFKRSG